MNQIILASSSPRRKELLENAGIDFIVDASSIDEKMDETLPLLNRLKQLAKDKATPIHNKYPQDIVIGADTIVYYDSIVIGKPKDENDARRILNMLSQHKHTVYTAVAIYIKDKLYSFVDQTDVYFCNVSDMLDEYIQSQEWQGKAGAYAIQGKADCFVDHIDGDINTVIGLPIEKVIHILKEENII